jgi:ABC-type transport system involved in multi-copper enzyme maturation permease subunit
MSLKVLRQTLLDKWKSIGLVTALFFVFMAYYTALYPSTASMSTAGLNEMLENPMIKVLLGNLHWDNSFESYLTIKGLTFTGLIAGGFVAWLTAGFLSGEVDHKTIDLLLAQPIIRTRLVLTRYAALIIAVIIMMAAMLIGIVVAVKALAIDTSIPWLAYTLFYMGMLTLAFGAIALFISAVLSDGRKAALTSLGVLVIMYFMETVGSIVDLLGPIRYLSLFHYARYNEMLVTRTLSLADFGVMLAVAIVFVAMAVYVFRRRDIMVA